MIPELETLVSDIKRYNPYFNNGFANAYLNSEGIYQSGTEQLLFPNDTLGNYFYIRPIQPISISSNASSQISSCASGFDINSQCVLVASVHGADKMILINNLLSTISHLAGRIRSVVLQPEVVIIQELQPMGEIIVNSSIANLDKRTCLVSLIFDFYVPLPLTQLNCLPNPCSECSG